MLHPGHRDADRLVDDSLWYGESAMPLAGGWPVLRVDTSALVDIDRLCSTLENMKEADVEMPGDPSR